MTDLEFKEKISIILRQTDCSELEAGEKLKEFEMDHIKTIKYFLNILEKPAEPIKSIQKEMYKQMRLKLDESVREYNLKQEQKLINDINENEINS